MCGNGLRCLFRFAQSLGAIDKRGRVETAASVLTCHQQNDLIAVLHPTPQIIEREIRLEGRSLELVDSGVPHALIFTDDIQTESVYETGKAVRFHPYFSPHGVNVTFIQPCVHKNQLMIRTYERGVEDETQACGTAAVAAAFASLQKFSLARPLEVITLSKEIFYAEQTKDGMELKGPAVLSYKGEIFLQEKPNDYRHSKRD